MSLPWYKRWLYRCDDITDSTLHAIVENQTVWDDGEYGDTFCTATTVCGQELWMCIPGISGRMWNVRCPDCCRKMNLPDGYGNPFNDPELK